MTPHPDKLKNKLNQILSQQRAKYDVYCRAVNFLLQWSQRLDVQKWSNMESPMHIQCLIWKTCVWLTSAFSSSSTTPSETNGPGFTLSLSSSWVPSSSSIWFWASSVGESAALRLLPQHWHGKQSRHTMLYCAPPKASLQKSERRPGRAESSRSCESASSWMKTCTATWSGSLTPRSWMPTARGKVSDRDSGSSQTVQRPCWAPAVFPSQGSCLSPAETPTRTACTTWRARARSSTTSESESPQEHICLPCSGCWSYKWCVFLLLLLSLQPFGPSLESFLPDEVLGVRENQGFLLAGDVPCLPQHLDHSNRAPPSVWVAHLPSRLVILLYFSLFVHFITASLINVVSLASYHHQTWPAVCCWCCSSSRCLWRCTRWAPGPTSCPSSTASTSSWSFAASWRWSCSRSAPWLPSASPSSGASGCWGSSKSQSESRRCKAPPAPPSPKK